jgi:hypothetical protein
VHSDFPNADLQKVFMNKIKRVQDCIGARGHHFQHLLKVHSNFPNVDLQKLFANKIKQVQACIDPRGHHFQHFFISAQRLSELTVYMVYWMMLSSFLVHFVATAVIRDYQCWCSLNVYAFVTSQLILSMNTRIKGNINQNT